MANILKTKHPNDVYIISKTEDQYPQKYKNQSNKIFPLEEYINKTIVLDDVLVTKLANYIDQFFTQGKHQQIDMN